MADSKELVYDDLELASLEQDDVYVEGDFDPDAEYNRPAPPVPDGWYYGSVSNSGIKDKESGDRKPFRESQWRNENSKHFEVNVKGTIASPDNPLTDGKFVYVEKALRSKPEEDRNNQSGIGGAFLSITGGPIPGVRENIHTLKFVELLKTEPECWFYVRNCLKDIDAEMDYGKRKKEGSLEEGEKKPKAVYGQKAIMALNGGTDSRGNFTGAADHPNTGVRCVSRPYITKFQSKDNPPKQTGR